MKILYQGNEGAYSQLAALEIFPNAALLSCKTFEECFKKCSEDDNLRAIIPIENSIAGRVADIQYLMNKYKLQIYAEHFHKVSHNLIARPGVKFKNLKFVRSHSQAISQCQKLINEYNLEPIIAADTAGSAKYISENLLTEEAAIASSLAGKTYGLKVIDENFANSLNNITRFYVMSKNENLEFDKKKTYISSFLFSVKNTPGSLFKVMGGFATNNVNMIKLESYNYGADFVITQFYCEIEGHPEQDNTKFALDDMYHYCSKVRKLGVFEKSPYRVRQ